MKILLLTNKFTLSKEDEERIRQAIKKLEEVTPFTFEVERKAVSIPIKYKSFDDTSLVKGLYGLDGIKQDIRNLNLGGEYDIIWYMYESTMKGIAYWTYPNDLNGAVFCEFPVNPTYGKSLRFALGHETLHAFHRMLNWKGIYTKDTLDEYDGYTDFPEGSSYKRNLSELSKYWSVLDATPLAVLTKENKPQYIIIHHTGSEADNFDSVKSYHISKGWGDIAYHYFIEKDGTIRYGRDEKEVGTHCLASGMNFKSIGICLQGNFNASQPTSDQLNSLAQLIVSIKEKYNIQESNVLAHGKVKGAMTQCAGKYLQVFLDNRKRSIIIEKLKVVLDLTLKLFRK